MVDGLQVKGYLGLPEASVVNAGALSAWFRDVCEVDIPLSRNVPPKASSPELSAWPALIYCRGGIGRVGAVKLDWIQSFAEQGFVVFAPCYRGNEGGQGRDQFGGADVADVTDAIRILQQVGFVKADRISLLGFSRGAINAFGAARIMPEIHRVVTWGGVADLAAIYEERQDLRRMLRRVLGGTPTRVLEAYLSRSPLSMAPYIYQPVLIVHGTEDIQVSVSHATRLHHLFTELERDATLWLCDGYGHHLPPAVHASVVKRMMDWIRHGD